jgi:uncharacterized protein YecE (DUF72 family)
MTARGAGEGTRPRLWIGTSGWVYPHWVDVLYPPDLPQARWLSFYAARFATVEVNYTFYRLPDRSVFEAWQAQTPPGFLFSVKASRYLTHLKRLIDPAEPLARLLDRARGLGPKLGPLLVQLPPNFPCNLDRLDGFLAALKAHPGHRWTLEFRHPSWLVRDVYVRLERAGVALCLPVGPGIPLDVRQTAPFVYVRMHAGARGPGFDARALSGWARKVEAFQALGSEVFVYFNNDIGGHAIRDADRLRDEVGAVRR